MGKKTKDLDKKITASLKKEDWEAIIKEFQNNVSDAVIETAIRKQPQEIFDIKGNKIIEKLKSRRDGLFKHVMKYYDLLQES